MNRRWRNFWIILGVLLSIPVSILAVIQVWSWIAPNTAELNTFVKIDKVEIPSAYRQFLRAVDPYGKRKDLITIHDAAATALKQQKGPQSIEDSLAALRAFADSVSIFFPVMDPQVITVKIENVVRKMADDVKVFFPTEGFVEVTKDDGAPVIAEQKNKGWIDLLMLEPTSQFVVKFWTTNLGDVNDVRVVSNEGRGPSSLRSSLSTIWSC